MGKLPAYMKFSTDGKPLPGSTICSGNVRITVITPRLIRLEQGSWTDSASTVVLHRDFCPCSFTVKESPELLTVETEYLKICYRNGTTLSEGLSIRGLTEPGFIWRFGKKPLQNLGGTVSTLDGIEGACPMGEGVCSIDGYAVIDDSESLLFDEEGWLLQQEQRQGQNQDQENIQEAMFWVWQGGSCHCGMP